MTDAAAMDRPKGRSLGPLKTLWPFLKPYRGTLVAAGVVLVIAAMAMLGLPIALRFLIDEGFAADDVDTVNRYFCVVLSAPPSSSASSRRCASTW